MVKLKYFAILAFLLLLIKFFGGVYEDDEFNGRFFFVKNKPCWKWYFYSPRGMSDRKVDQMSQQEREDQAYYDEYVSKRVLSFPIWKK